MYFYFDNLNLENALKKYFKNKD